LLKHHGDREGAPNLGGIAVMSVQVQLRRDTYANVAANHGAAGEVFVDTTNQRLVVQDGATAGGFPAPVTLFVGNSGSTNNSNAGSGAYVNHTPAFTIPANFMIAARAFRLTAHFQLTTGSAPPMLTYRLSLGSTVIFTSAALSVGVSMTNAQAAFQWIIQATQAPGAAANSMRGNLSTERSWVHGGWADGNAGRRCDQRRSGAHDRNRMGHGRDRHEYDRPEPIHP
jgi:hypothetical protein